MRDPSESKSLERCVLDTIEAIQHWASSPAKTLSCGSGTDGLCHKRGSARYSSSQRRESSAVFDLVGLEDSKYSEDAPFFNSVKCSGKGLSSALGGESLNCIVLSEDCSMSEDDDQMRRLGSWGTFGTIGTNESLDNLTFEEMKVDDDGNPIHPQLIEKAKQKREKIQIGTSKKRAVQFAYPPISSLRQCPRIDPEEIDLLFFSDEELETYENDRRLAGTVDDIEIVAVSTSFSDDVVPAPPSKSQDVAPASSHCSPSKKSAFSKFLLTPRARKSLTGFQESQNSELRDSKLKNAVPSDSKTWSVSDATSSRSFVEKLNSAHPTEKRLLKSVQIFLRARSTA